MDVNLSHLKGCRVAVAMSGGVDSSVTAWLLREAGAEPVGFTLRLWDSQPDAAPPEFVVDARAVAANLGIPHHVIDLRPVFRETIVTPFVDAYVRGETPSPCVWCNRGIKFGALLDEALRLGCAHLATGHYAKVVDGPGGRRLLRRGVDPDKDQSYFLFGLSQHQLHHALFPLGGCCKREIRALAAEHGIRRRDTGESQDLCFLGGGGYESLLLERVPGLDKPGPIIDSAGRVRGEHRGYFRYTRGQRRGLGLGGGPWYVLRVEPATNTVVVGTLEEAQGRSVSVTGLNWVAAEHAAGAEFRALVQVRYRMRPVSARVAVGSADSATVALESSVTGIAPGQAAVFYDGDTVLGGGWIAGTA